MKRKHKLYSRPKRPFEKIRIDEEAKIKEEFGLKNKKEIWKAEARIKSIRERAKKLISSDAEKQKSLFEKLNSQGFKVNSIADILSLTKQDYLKRRLQTVLVEKKLANSPRHARQLLVHKKVLINDRVVNTPSYVVPLSQEKSIKVKKPKVKIKKEKSEEIKVEEVKNE